MDLNPPPPVVCPVCRRFFRAPQGLGGHLHYSRDAQHVAYRRDHPATVRRAPPVPAKANAEEGSVENSLSVGDSYLVTFEDAPPRILAKGRLDEPTPDHATPESAVQDATAKPRPPKTQRAGAPEVAATKLATPAADPPTDTPLVVRPAEAPPVAKQEPPAESPIKTPAGAFLAATGVAAGAWTLYQAVKSLEGANAPKQPEGPAAPAASGIEPVPLPHDLPEWTSALSGGASMTGGIRPRHHEWWYL